MTGITKTQMSAAELRSRVNELAVRIPGIIEKAADTIGENSADPQTRRRTLVWKIEAIPAIQRILFHPDPLAALFDAWVLGFQMHHYYSEGSGADLFGPFQPTAVEACRKSLAEIDGVVQRLWRFPDKLLQGRKDVEKWAREHSLDGNYLTRESVAPLLMALVSGEAGGLFEQLGSVTETVSDLSGRVSIYAEFMPKIARWNAELLADDVARRDDVLRIKGELENLRKILERLGEVAGDLPELLDNTEKRAFATLATERRAALADFERQRLETLREINAFGLRTVDQTGDKFSRMMEGMERRLLAALAAERKVLLTDIDRQRFETLREVEVLAQRMLDQTENKMQGAIDHLAWRLVQLAAGVLAVLGFFCLLGLLIAKRLLSRRA